VLFHIAPREAWQRAVASGLYRAPSLDTEGFIHLSTEAQWPKTLARFFFGATDLLLLVIDPVRVHAAIRFEPADGEDFPHLYGPLEVSAVVEVREL
jgi:uncharacterized protein (DUF952 family)